MRNRLVASDPSILPCQLIWILYDPFRMFDPMLRFPGETRLKHDWLWSTFTISWRKQGVPPYELKLLLLQYNEHARRSGRIIIMILIKIYLSLSIQSNIHFAWMQLFHPNNHPSPSVATSWSRCEKFRASLAWSSWPFPSLKLAPFTVEQWPDSPLGYLVYTLPKTNSSHG